MACAEVCRCERVELPPLTLPAEVFPARGSLALNCTSCGYEVRLALGAQRSWRAQTWVPRSTGGPCEPWLPPTEAWSWRNPWWPRRGPALGLESGGQLPWLRPGT